MQATAPPKGSLIRNATVLHPFVTYGDISPYRGTIFVILPYKEYAEDALPVRERWHRVAMTERV